MELVRPGGVICLDNVFWHGGVIDEDDTSKQAMAIRATNTFIHNDARVDMSMLPIVDGMTIVLKRHPPSS